MHKHGISTLAEHKRHLLRRWDLTLLSNPVISNGWTIAILAGVEVAKKESRQQFPFIFNSRKPPWGDDILATLVTSLIFNEPRSWLWWWMMSHQTWTPRGSTKFKNHFSEQNQQYYIATYFFYMRDTVCKEYYYLPQNLWETITYEFRCWEDFPSQFVTFGDVLVQSTWDRHDRRTDGRMGGQTGRQTDTSSSLEKLQHCSGLQLQLFRDSQSINLIDAIIDVWYQHSFITSHNCWAPSKLHPSLFITISTSIDTLYLIFNIVHRSILTSKRYLYSKSSKQLLQMPNQRDKLLFHGWSQIMSCPKP